MDKCIFVGLNLVCDINALFCGVLAELMKKNGLLLEDSDRITIKDNFKSVDLFLKTKFKDPKIYEQNVSYFKNKLAIALDSIEKDVSQIDALRNLSMQGIKIYIISNLDSKATEKILDKTNIRAYIKSFVTEEDVNKTKPHPEIYIKTALQTGTRYEYIHVFENTEDGIAAASGFNVHIISREKFLDIEYLKPILGLK